MTIADIEKIKNQMMIEEGKNCYAVQLFGRVRRLQKRYFKTRDRNDLIASKEAEKQADELLKKMGVQID